MAKKLGNYVQDLRMPKGFLRDIRCLRMLDLHGPQGILAVWYLYDYTAEHFPSSGRLEGMSTKDIHLACNVSKESMSFVGDLIDCGFLAQGADGVYYLPNWRDEQPHVAKAEERSEAGRAAVKKRGGSWASGVEGAPKEAGGGKPDSTLVGKYYSNTNPKAFKSPPTPPEGGQKEHAPVKEIVELYHEVLPELPKLPEETEKVRKDIGARWASRREHRSLEWWRWFFEQVHECPYLLGEGKDGWRASLGWLVNKGNMDKVLGGEYPKRNEAGPGESTAQGYSLEEFERMQVEQGGAPPG